MNRIGQNYSRVKQTNRLLILQTLLKKGMMSRQQLSKETQLTPASITNIVGELIQEGLLTETGELPNEKTRVGRKSVAIGFSPNSIYVVGVHIRTDRIEIALINLVGHVSNFKTISFPENIEVDNFLHLLEELIDDVIKENKHLNIGGIGIGSVGLVDYEKGSILSIHYLGWQNIDISRYLSDIFDLPVFVDNNARAMSLAEKMFGNNKEINNFLYVFIGHGIGAGLIINDRVFRGGITGAGELGHMTLIPNGKECWCGNRGCLERYASESYLLQELGLDSVEELLELTRKKDEQVLDLLNITGERLATILTSFINMFYVEKIIVAGDLIYINDDILNNLNAINKNSFLARHDNVQIEVSTLGENIGVVGAGSLVLYHSIFTMN